jgi:uncharacterized membrane protein YdbT with pleckstrin-like domain
MSNISDKLMPGEQILVEERQHWFVLIPWAIFLIPILKWSKTSVAVTNKRIIAVSGIISPDTFESRLNKIASVGLDQSIMGRIFNYGSLVLADTAGEKFVYSSITNAKKIRQVFSEAQDRLEGSR